MYMEGAARRELQLWITVETDSLSEPTTRAAAEALEAPILEPGTYTWGHGVVGRVVRALPKRQRELLTHRYIEDASLAEIATIVGPSSPAVSQRLATARRAVAS